MKKQLLSLILAGFLLVGCGPDPETEDSSATNSDLVFDYGDEEPAEYGDVDSPYTVGSTTNTNDSFDYDTGIYVNQPTNELNEDFMYVVDVSSVYEVEKYGGRFYDKEGKEADMFTIMKEGGANYVRLRLWNDPYDASGNPYGGGTNDLSTDIYLAKRAVAAGLKVMVDFHYSDHWADPSKYWIPKAWAGSAVNIRYQQIGKYTGAVLNAFKEAGITVDAVQIGNEINNGLAGLTGYSGYPYSRSIKAGYTTAKSIFPNIKTIVHLTNVETASSSIYPVLNALKSNDAFDFDIVGLTYYPFWDGTQENILSVMNYITENYNKQVMIAETSYGYTLDYLEDYANNQFSDGSVESGGYLATVQGQATEMADIIDLLSQVNDQNGVGIAYWETGWLPVKGSTWATKEGEYYNTYGCDPDYETDPDALSGYSDSSTYSSWANQAWFTYKGRVLPSAYTYKYVQEGGHTKDLEVTSLYSSDTVTGTYDKNSGAYSLPSTVNFQTNLDSLIETNIVWDSSEYENIPTYEVGQYTLTGTATCGSLTATITCTVSVVDNMVDDYSFENQNTTLNSSQEFDLTDPWSVTRDYENVRVENKGEMASTGEKYFKWWAGAGDLNFELSQTISDVPAGDYDFYVQYARCAWYETYTYDFIGLFVEIDGVRTTYSMWDFTHMNGASAATDTVPWEIDGVVTVNKTSDVTIGVSCINGANGAWAQLDDFFFVPAS